MGADARTAVNASKTEHLRQEIIKKMEHMGISDERLAGMIHMDRNALKLRLNGEREFRLSELIEIAACLHMIIVIGA